MTEYLVSKEFSSYFYFGIFSKPDYEYVSSIISYFEDKWKLLALKSCPTHKNFSFFQCLIDQWNYTNFRYPDHFNNMKACGDDFIQRGQV